WIRSHGDCDGDGFVEYCQRASGGVINQGWKDSGDAIFYTDGSLPAAPIALFEVQGYVYEAKTKAALLAEALGYSDEAAGLTRAVREFKTRFHDKFWCEDIQTYAIALDGAKQPCRIRSSNAGQCLFTGV